MLNLKHLFGRLPPSVVDHQLLFLAVGTVSYWLILGYYKGQSRKVRNIILTDISINANCISVKPNLSPLHCQLETLQLTHIPSTEFTVPLFSLLGAVNYLLDARKVINAGLKKVSILCSYDLLQAMLREASQWPNTMFKIPDLLQWIVVATEPSMIEEIRKAPDDVLSFLDALEEVSSFLSSPRCSPE